MPLIFKNNIDLDTIVGVWKITETETELWKGLILSETDKNAIFYLPLVKRRLEKIVCRKALASLLKQNEIRIEYGKNGEPFMNGFYISFSHSGEMVAVAASASKPIGIDIEKIRDKIVALQSKFVAENELSSKELINKETITRVWTAKEAVYKLFSENTPDFKKQIIVQANKADVLLQGTIHSVKLFHWQIKEYICTISLR